MGNMWDSIIKEVDEGFPPFNDKLLVDFRKDLLEGIEPYFDVAFKEIVKMFDGRLKYVGYHTLTPKERIAYLSNMQDNKINKKRMEIQDNSLKIVKYEFIFQEKSYFMHVHIPYLDPYAIILSDTFYYPQFPIVEKGLHRIDKGVLIKVMKSPINIWKKDTSTFSTTTGNIYREQLITIKIHQGVKRGKKTEKTPLLLYIFIYHGLYGTLNKLGFKDHEFDLVTTFDDNDKNYKYIKIKSNIFIKIHISVLDDIYKRRVIGSLITIFKFHRRFTIPDLVDPDAKYFKVTLGKYNQPYTSKDGILFKHAEKHLKSNETLFDIMAQRQLSNIDIQATNIQELLFESFYKIDKWISEYVPNDLYEKRIGGLDQMVEGLIRNVVTVAYNIVNDKQGLTLKNIKSFIQSASKQKWFSGSTMFRSNPQIYNDNWLLSIGGKRFRSIDNPHNNPHNTTKTKVIPTELIKAHPSQAVVESILAIPSSNPCVSGTINPFIETDEDGNIIKPDYAYALDNVFK